MVTPNDLAMVAPLFLVAAVSTLNEAHAFLHKPPGHQALPKSPVVASSSPQPSTEFGDTLGLCEQYVLSR